MFKHFGLLSFILLFTLSACKEKEVDQFSGTFKALSYNVAGLPSGISSSQPLRNMVLISPLLNDFDIVHVQEDFCYHDSLLLHNDHRYVTEPIPCIGDGLNTFSNYKILEFERQKWEDCTSADCLSLKGFSYSKIALAKGVTIDFYNIHCNAGKNEASIDARRNNLYQFLDYVNQKSANEPLIIMGDFNHKYTRLGDSTRLMLELGFSDPWLDLITNGQIPDYDTTGLSNCFPINTSIDCEGVDKAFYRSNDEMKIKAIAYQYGDVNRYYYQGNTNEPLSDHSPLFVTFQVEFNRN